MSKGEKSVALLLAPPVPFRVNCVLPSLVRISSSETPRVCLEQQPGIYSFTTDDSWHSFLCGEFRLGHEILGWLQVILDIYITRVSKGFLISD